MIVRDMVETKFLADYISGAKSTAEFLEYFDGKLSEAFNPEEDLSKIGVVNQTTMLASETEEIANYLKDTVESKFGIENLKDHFADTRDTLCYATNDNQSATLELLNIDADLAIVVGGYNSSNTSHLVELLEPKFKTYFIKNEKEIISRNEIYGFSIHSKKPERYDNFLPEKEHLKIIITSGASCPDSVVDSVMQKVLALMNIPFSNELVDL